jgi:hypothetical protein
MLGAIVGDIVGSVYEFDDQFRSKDFPLFREDSKFTDDTILTVATADALMTDLDFAAKYRAYGKKYPFVWCPLWCQFQDHLPLLKSNYRATNSRTNVLLSDFRLRWVVKSIH